MGSGSRYFKFDQPAQRSFTRGDLLVLIGLAVLILIGVRFALSAPLVIEGPAISLSPSALPLYAGLSMARMSAAYLLSLVFTLVYGRMAASNLRAERILMPLLDVLQSVPILSFLPVVLLSLSAVLPENIAVELASVILIFTSQAWNMTYAWYQSLTTIPKELREASTIYHFNGWLRFKMLELPFAAISLIWNSVMSWAGGWFFLMAAEIFTVGQRDFRLPGLGAYLQEAANQGNFTALGAGLFTLILLVVVLDQLVWRPLLAMGDRFKLEMVESEHPPTSWFYEAIHSSVIIDWLKKRLWRPMGQALDGALLRRFPVRFQWKEPRVRKPRQELLFVIPGLAFLIYGGYRVGIALITLPVYHWEEIGIGLLATLLRVAAALIIALAWTIPVGVAIGTNPRLATFLQPVVQIAASVPATALFPAFILILLDLPGGIDMAAVLLMLLGTQWYLLFNIIAGASAIPQDLKYTTTMLQIKGWQRWKTLILPALFPYLITGAITASGGAWNASIVAEHVKIGSQDIFATGIGAIIAGATGSGDYSLLLAATLSLILAVVTINRLLWRRLYRLAEQRFRME